MTRHWGAAFVLCLAGSVVAGLAAAGDYAGTNGSFSADIYNTDWGHDEMRIKYTPDPTKVTCGAIYLIQTVRAKDQNGAVIQPKDLKPSGDIPGQFENLQDDITEGGTVVDHEPSEKDPEYNGQDDDGKDKTSKGSSDGTTATATEMTDEPYIPDAWFPAGVTSVTLEFETCAVCKDNGTVLDCVTWSYVRAKNSAGHGSITEPAGTAAAPPTDEFKKAKAKFVKNHDDDKKCPEEKADENPGEENASAGFHQTLPPFPHPNQPTQVLVDVVNSSAQPMNGIAWRAVDLGGTRLLAQGVVPFLEPFSFAMVAFAVPPVPSPNLSDVVVFTVDPTNAIPEYDETDNASSIPIGYFGAVGVGGDGAGPPGERLSVSPNPFRTLTRVSLVLARPADARVEVFDAAGERIKVLHAGRLEARGQIFDWDGRCDSGRLAPPGVYWLRVKYSGRALEQKLLLLR